MGKAESAASGKKVTDRSTKNNKTNEALLLGLNQKKRSLVANKDLMNLEKNSNYISPNKNDEAIKKSIQDEKMADTQV